MRTLLAAALAVGLTGLAGADEKRTGTPAEQIKAIEKEFDTVLNTANKEIAKAAPDKRAELVKNAREKFGKLVDEAVALADANPNDPAATPALAFVAARAGFSPNGAAAYADPDAASQEIDHRRIHERHTREDIPVIEVPERCGEREQGQEVEVSKGEQPAEVEQP